MGTKKMQDQIDEGQLFIHSLGHIDETNYRVAIKFGQYSSFPRNTQIFALVGQDARPTFAIERRLECRLY